MIEHIESRRLLAATTALVNSELRVEVVSKVSTSIEVTYTNSRIAVHVQDEGAKRRVYSGLRRAISTIRIVGSDAADRITLGEGIRATVVEAGAGKDTVIGNKSANTIYGGDGNDSLVGLDGDDVIYGQDGRDTIYGGEGNDQLLGGDDIDKLYGENGADKLDGGLSRHTDFFDGGAGVDLLIDIEQEDSVLYDGVDRFIETGIRVEGTITTPGRRG